MHTFITKQSNPNYTFVILIYIEIYNIILKNQFNDQNFL